MWGKRRPGAGARLLHLHPVDEDSRAEVHQLVDRRGLVVHPEHQALQADEVECDVERALVVGERDGPRRMGHEVVDGAQDTGHEAVALRVRRDEPADMNGLRDDGPRDGGLLLRLEEDLAAEGRRHHAGPVPREDEGEVDVVVAGQVGLDLRLLEGEHRGVGTLVEVVHRDEGGILARDPVVDVADEHGRPLRRSWRYAAATWSRARANRASRFAPVAGALPSAISTHLRVARAWRRSRARDSAEWRVWSGPLSMGAMPARQPPP